MIDKALEQEGVPMPNMKKDANQDFENEVDDESVYNSDEDEDYNQG